MSGVAFPPEPWDLAGRGWITTWRVPEAALPPLPFGVRPLTLRGTAWAVTAFVAYSEAGQMAYDELLAAVVVRHRRRVRLSITDIWVDSHASRAGGRALWGIPKELAGFERADHRADSEHERRATRLAAHAGGAPIASAGFVARRGPVVPLPVPLPGSVVQTRSARTLTSPIRAGGRVRPARADWTLDPVGPLAWLRAASPGPSVVADDFRMRFGSA